MFQITPERSPETLTAAAYHGDQGKNGDKQLHLRRDGLNDFDGAGKTGTDVLFGQNWPLLYRLIMGPHSGRF